MAEIKKYFDANGNELIPVYDENIKQIEDIQSGLAGLHYSYYENPSIYDYILKNKPINETIISVNDINTNKQIIIFENMEIGYNEDDETDILKQSFSISLISENDKVYGGTKLRYNFSNNQNQTI